MDLNCHDFGFAIVILLFANFPTSTIYDLVLRKYVLDEMIECNGAYFDQGILIHIC